MTNEQILEQQVEALEKLLKLKQAIIEEQELKINKLQGTTTIPNMPPMFPNGIQGVPWGQAQPMWDRCTNSPNGTHQYPTVWGGTIPPFCTYCNKQQQTLTIGSGTGYATAGGTGNTALSNAGSSLAGKSSV